jgi:hypothetical protein
MTIGAKKSATLEGPGHVMAYMSDLMFEEILT